MKEIWSFYGNTCRVLSVFATHGIIVLTISSKAIKKPIVMIRILALLGRIEHSTIALTETIF